jgi:hypothetical protein
MKDAFGHPAGLVIAVVMGSAFGFVLERAGFGRATILAAQFYFKDMRVFKVMFTAIVTALLGMTILSGLGMLDLSALYVPATFVWPHLIGGLLLGAGFIISGYCPGTGVVALASGKVDGLVAIFGVMLGSILFGAAFPLISGFYTSGDLGPFTFPQLLGVPQAVVALGVTVMAIGAFIGAEKLERIFTGGTVKPAEYIRLRRPVFAGLAVVALLGIATIFLPQPGPAQSEQRLGTITPVEFAELAIEAPTSYFLVDLRVLDEDAKRIPGAMALTAEDPDGSFIANLPATRKLIVYNGETISEVPPSVSAFEGQVFVIEGGYEVFESDVLTAPVLGENPSAGDVAEFQLRSALHAHFTGSSIKKAPAPPRPKIQIRKADKKEGGC